MDHMYKGEKSLNLQSVLRIEYEIRSSVKERNDVAGNALATAARPVSTWAQWAFSLTLHRRPLRDPSGWFYLMVACFIAL
jgi:hypothetical protein